MQGEQVSAQCSTRCRSFSTPRKSVLINVVHQTRLSCSYCQPTSTSQNIQLFADKLGGHTAAGHAACCDAQFLNTSTDVSIKRSAERQDRQCQVREHPLEHSNSGKKSFDSIRFSLPNRFFRFDSIRQSDKFAACTLIFK